MSDSHIDYDTRVQSALRSVVREVLRDTAEYGLQGDHHFYVAFKTQAEGVDIPAHLASRFPDEMTIVIQHKFWGLNVYDDHFEIGLSFNQKPEHLSIPFDAVLGFVDPSVQFALQFHDDDYASLQEGVDDLDALADDEDTMTSRELLQTASAPESNSDSDSDSDNNSKVVTLDAFRRK